MKKNISVLKTVRMVLSLLFFLVYLAFFLNLLSFVPWLAGALSGAQFLPSLSRFLGGSALFLLLPALFAAATLFFGRFYCSSVCPLGSLQDTLIFPLRRIFKRRKYSYRRSLRPVQIALFAITLALFLFGNVLLFRITEPFSVFGRIASELFLPAAVFFGKSAARLLSFAGISLSADTYPPLGIASLAVAAVSLVVLAVLVFFRGRLFCNLICPTGAVFGILSRFSVFRIQLDKDTCTSCGNCESVCRAECIDSTKRDVDPSRCVLCFDCLSVCPVSAVKYGPARKNKTIPAAEGEGRRKFLAVLFGAGVTVLAASNRLLAGVVSRYRPKELPVKNPVMPPGAGDLLHYTSKCTACGLCVSVCPNRVLRPSFLELGLAGILQPVADYRFNFCGYECNICTEVCPTGALRKTELKEKKLTRIGSSNLIRENCIVYAEDLDCGACAEHCPTQAVYMTPYKGELNGPVLDPELCIGCGACEYVCPSTPFKAIYVDGKKIHERARPRNDKKLKRNTGNGGFPF